MRWHCAGKLDAKGDARVNVEYALLELFRVADTLSIDLLREIDRKCEKNKGRERLHGKINSVG